MQRFVDIYIVYQIVKKLTTPFTKTEAFKRGIIDKNGLVLRPYADLKNPADKAAWTWLDVLLNNIKRVFVRLPGGQSTFFSMAAALFMMRQPLAKLKELSTRTGTPLLEGMFGPDSADSLMEAFDLIEDAPGVSAGAGAIAGVGVGADGEPGKLIPSVFAGCRVIGTDAKTFRQCRRKLQDAKYTDYVDRDQIDEHMQSYRDQYVGEGIILMDDSSGAIFYLQQPTR